MQLLGSELCELLLVRCRRRIGDTKVSQNGTHIAGLNLLDETPNDDFLGRVDHSVVIGLFVKVRIIVDVRTRLLAAAWAATIELQSTYCALAVKAVSACKLDFRCG
eukprot:5396389-Prymnesium_polylepis.1